MVKWDGCQHVKKMQHNRPAQSAGQLKEPPTWLKVAITLEKPLTPTHNGWRSGQVWITVYFRQDNTLSSGQVGGRMLNHTSSSNCGKKPKSHTPKGVGWGLVRYDRSTCSRLNMRRKVNITGLWFGLLHQCVESLFIRAKIVWITCSQAPPPSVWLMWRCHSGFSQSDTWSNDIKWLITATRFVKSERVSRLNHRVIQSLVMIVQCVLDISRSFSLNNSRKTPLAPFTNMV